MATVLARLLAGGVPPSSWEPMSPEDLALLGC
jgi:hypothetical protein